MNHVTVIKKQMDSPNNKTNFRPNFKTRAPKDLSEEKPKTLFEKRTPKEPSEEKSKFVRKPAPKSSEQLKHEYENALKREQSEQQSPVIAKALFDILQEQFPNSNHEAVCKALKEICKEAYISSKKQNNEEKYNKYSL